MTDGEELYGTKAECIAEALSDAEHGDIFRICRGDWNTCPTGSHNACQFCARIRFERGMTADDVLALATVQ